jgi:two-component system, cell cycle response regulator
MTLHTLITPSILDSSPTRVKPCVLAVDDDRILRMVLVNMLEELGYEVLEAENGRRALDIIKEQKTKIDAVLLDREMPVMDGMELVMRMKEHPELRQMPIIMQTGSDKPEQIKQGIDAGVFYYLTKPVNQDILKSVLSAAIRETEQQRLLSQELKKHKTSFNLIQTCVFRFNTVAEAEHLAPFLANCFPDAERVVSGLVALLVNAVEHGHLEIHYQEKTALVANGLWRDEVNRRAERPENKLKEVVVTYQRTPEGCQVTIRDQGQGFDWKNYMHIDPARASDNHGRGIAHANAMSFSRLLYNDIGNEVTAYMNSEKALEW